MIRKPVVAGQFYPETKEVTIKQIQSFLEGKDFKKRHTAKGLILPHAGYVCSGEIAAEAIATYKLADIIIILGTKHTYFGKKFSLAKADVWQTPLGSIEVDMEFSSLLLKESNYIEESDEAHLQEHSIEVILPLLQCIKGNFKFIPIIISSADKKTYENIGKDIAKIAKELKKDITIIASTDLSHYEVEETAQKKDKIAIKAILELNTDKLIKVLEEFNISMCGYAPTCVMIEATKELGAKKTELIKYGTSGKVTGDYSAVVGYAGIGIY